MNVFNRLPLVSTPGSCEESSIDSPSRARIVATAAREMAMQSIPATSVIHGHVSTLVGGILHRIDNDPLSSNERLLLRAIPLGSNVLLTRRLKRWIPMPTEVSEKHRVYLERLLVDWYHLGPARRHCASR